MMRLANGPRLWMVAAVTALLLVVGYWNGLDGAFVFDDEGSVSDNSSIRSLWPLSRVLFTSGETGRTHDGRPLVNLSFAISYAAHELWRPGWRIGNLVLHLVNACLVFEIARRLLRMSHDGMKSDARSDADARSRWLAAAIAVVWAVHPLHTHVNTYIVQRAESLAATFILGAFLAALAALDRGNLAAAGLATALAALGGLTKETTVAILPLVAVFDWAYHDRFAMRSDAARARLTRGWIYAGLAMNPLVIFGTMAATGGRGTSAGFSSAPVVGYALTQCGAVWMYLGKIFWPHTLVLDHGDGLATLATAWPWLVLTLMALAAIAVGFWRRPRVFFPAVAAVLLLAPSSSVMPVKTQTVAEHRVYLASAAVIGLVLAAAFAAARRTASSPRPGALRGLPLVAGMAVALVVFASLARTVTRNRDFATATALWTQNLRDCPRNPRGLDNLVTCLRHEQRYDIAATVCREALAIPELAPHAACGLGDTLVRLGDWQAADEAYAAACRLPGRIDAARFAAHAGRAACQVRMGASAAALAVIEAMNDPRWKDVPMPPDRRRGAFGRALVARAAAIRQIGSKADADAAIAKAIDYAATHADAAEAIARGCDDMREFAAAAAIWEPLAAADASLLANLAVSRIEAGQIEGAIDAFRRAVGAFPDDTRMRQNLARAEALAAERSAEPKR